MEPFGEVLGNIWSGIWDGMVTYVKNNINGIIDVINWLISKVNEVTFEVPDWVPSIGGETFGINIPEIPKLSRGTDYVAKEGLAYLHEGEAVVPKNSTMQITEEHLLISITLSFSMIGI